MVEMFYKWLDTIPNPEKTTSPPEFGMIEDLFMKDKFCFILYEQILYYFKFVHIG